MDPELLGLTNAEFSTVIESDQPVIADRTMRWDASGYGSHAETSIGRPLTQWYLAEGATLRPCTNSAGPVRFKSSEPNSRASAT